MIIPRYIALESKNNHKYLESTDEDEIIKGFLRFTGENIVNPRSKFEVEIANCDSRLVHIRSCYNNKYWVSCTTVDDKQWVPTTNYEWVAAMAQDREEDQSKLTCTLFKPVYDAQHSAFKFVHVKFNIRLALSRHYSKVRDYGLNCIKSGFDLTDCFIITDWESLMILPKHVTFKGDNGCYLQGIWQEGHPYQQFSGNDIGDQRVPHETFMTTKGYVRIKSNYHGKFWRRDPDWIWADSDDTSSKDPNTLFWPIRLDNNHVALRCLGNNKFLGRVSFEWKTNCLNACTPTITTETKLKMEEPVISRSIYNVKYRLSDARIYDEKVMIMATQKAINKSSQSETITLKFMCSETKSSTWVSSTTWKLAAQTALKAGLPFIADGKITISAEFSKTYNWGESYTSTKTLETTQVVTVPAMSMMEVSLLATQGYCDVPFSYIQRDVLSNGKQVSHEFDDGEYNGINCYNFKYQTKETRL
ncbi:uncharacterized protein LOC120067663 [Benincasa hispida]|uniref:uncharacterized protein LOC120067663 n=1 Tax=Benincasa hispida TaxID=102211 RepID=UPI00190233CB|nr:uncharacterized protein LOC120067663 [Benincasa hispida]